MYTILDYLEEIGMERGTKEGMEKGLIEGREKGIKEGLEEGREEGRNQIYYKMFQNNKTPEDISDFTGESLEYLYEIQEKYLSAVREDNRYSCLGEDRAENEK